MRERIKKKFKKGAASFYIVAFSTLILLVVVTSFASIVISDLERTMNDDLSQSAYDSALAGVEDAKLAFYNYQNCVSLGADGAKTVPMGGALTCEQIIYYMQHPDCDMVGHILGRIAANAHEEVPLQEIQSNTNNMSQAYTCVKVTMPEDYKSTLSSENQSRTIRAKFSNVLADEVTRVKLSWYSKDDNTYGGTTPNNGYEYSNFSNAGNRVVFPAFGSAKVAAPPTISLAMTQTTNKFTLSDFYATKDGKTDRGLIYLVPTKDEKTADGSTYRASKWRDDMNYIGEEAFLKSNEKTVENLPYAVKCPDNSDSGYACTAMIDLPEPIGGARNDDTFLFTVAIPYGAPKTTFSLEFFCRTGNACGKKIVSNDDGTTTEVSTEKAYLDKVQIAVDATGRANDLYRRLDIRMDYGVNSTGASNSSLSIKGPLQLTGGSGSGGSGGSSAALVKDMVVTCEYNFGGTPTCP